MKALFADLMAYHHDLNLRTIHYFETLGDQVPTEALDWLSHMLNAQDAWNCRLKGEEYTGQFITHALETCMRLENENFKTSLDVLAKADLDSKIPYTNLKGEKYINSIRDILFHVTNHHTHHRAQIMSSLRKAGIQPMVTDFIVLNREKVE